MSINNLKLKYLEKKNQIIVFDIEGNLIDSCNTLLDVKKYQQESIYAIFPFLESIKITLINPTYPNNEHYFPRVEFTSENKTFVFDFTFYRQLNNNHIIWILEDLTKQYQHLYEIQKERNLSIIQKELAAIKNHSTLLQKEISYLNKNIKLKINQIIALNKILKQNLNKVKKLIKSPVLLQNSQPLQHCITSLNTEINTIIEELQNEIKNIPNETIEYSLNEIIWNIIKTFDYQKANKTIKINPHIPQNIPKKLIGDPTKFSQILYNLIDQLVKDTQHNNIQLHINQKPISEQNKTLQLNISIINSGKNTNTNIKKIEPKILNNNISLIIAQQLINNMGGTLSIETSPKQTITLIFTILTQHQ